MIHRSIARLCAGVLAACVLIVLPARLAASAADASSNPFARCATAGHAIWNVAHAGASSVAPQNTLAAARAALEAGADVWGVDVHRTKDGSLILMHDETLERTTNVEELFPDRSPWRVADFLLSEVETLDAGSWFIEEDPFGQIADGMLRPGALAAYAGEPVATLREALEFVAANEWLIDIEVKAPLAVDPDLIAGELVSLIFETGTSARALVSSFDRALLRAVREADAEIAIGLLALLPPGDLLKTLRSLEADVYLPSVVGFTDSLLADLEDEGIGVIVWTVNSEHQLRRVADLTGIDGIYTDFPQRLEALLEESE